MHATQHNQRVIVGMISMVRRIRQIFLSMMLFTALLLTQPAPGLTRNTVILALGDSLTAGYGLPEDKAFPAILEDRLRKRGYPAKVLNAGVSGDTTADGLARLDWVLGGLPRDNRILAILELGANDALRGIDPDVTRRNLALILESLQEQDIPVLLAGMRAPPNMGPAFTARFNAIFPALAKQFNVPLYPFFLAGVAGDPALNLRDGIHPNAQGIVRITENVLPLVIDFLEQHGVRPGP
jgi:acyl-CoA thioesterase I